jgi:2-amino-4-hydroxy-6-hydroxymethyldihydropteridine diphosphokinase
MPTTSTESVAYLSLGSNMGEREEQIQNALKALERLPDTRLLRKSPLYESKAWGKTDQADFLNMVVEVNTNLAPHTLLRHCQNIEKQLGREEGEKWGPRPIDIDILLFGDRSIRTATLVLPHARMWERHFVLRPLADLLPNLVGPKGVSIEEMLRMDEIAGSRSSLTALESKGMKVKIARVFFTLLILDFGFWILDFGRTGATPISYGASIPQSIQNPNPKSKIQNPKSKIQNPKSKMAGAGCLRCVEHRVRCARLYSLCAGGLRA